MKDQPVILALDSTAQCASVALLRGDKVLWQRTVCDGFTHSETLLPMIETALGDTKLTCDGIDIFACSAGPGSFTGVRIGTATVKGLAFGKNKPCVGVSSLEALAENLREKKGIICAAMDARREQVYCAIFESDGEAVTRLCPDRAMAASELCDELMVYSLPIYLCGDGYNVVQRACEGQIGFAPVTEEEKLQNAVGVARVALREYSKGNFVNDTELSPTYLRLAQAERERNERLAKEKAESENK